MTNKSFYTGVVGFLFGITAGSLNLVSWLGIFLTGIFSLGLAVWWRKSSTTTFAPRLFLLTIFLLAFTLGLFRTELYLEQFGHSGLADKMGEKVTLSGVVVSEPEKKELTQQFYFKTDTDKVLVSTERLLGIHYGDELLVTGKLGQPQTFVTELGRSFNYPAYLKVRGVEYRISFAKVEKISTGEGNFIVSALLSIKEKFIHALEEVIPEPSVSLGEGLLLGVKSALGDSLEQDFRRTGIIHIVVLSGYNITLVVGFVLYFLSFLFSVRGRIVFGFVSILAFVVIVGFSATVVRAAIMASLVLFAQLFSRHYNVLRGLLVAGLLMLMINPYLLLYDVGFQLSFMATLGLLLIANRLDEKLSFGAGWWGTKGFLLATLATQIAVTPLLLYHLGEVSVVALLVNLLVLPMVPVAMLLTFLAGIINLFAPTLALTIGYLANLSLDYILVTAHWFAQWNMAVMEVRVFPLWAIIFSYLLLGFAWWHSSYKRQKEDDSFKNWIIEEEEEVVNRLQQNGVLNKLKREELPVLFR